MKAPICMICKKWVSVSEETGGYVSFQVTNESQIKYNKQCAEGMPGHPFGLEMFCSEHLTFAEELAHLSWEEAEPLIRKAIDS
jgi:hypothetical protein